MTVFFSDGKDIFVEYVTNFNQIHKGDKLVFYRSRSDKKIVGDAVIEKIEYMSIEEVISKYTDRLFLSENELLSYANGRTKKMLVLTLSNFYQYPNPMVVEGITMVGSHVSPETYLEYKAQTRK